MHYKIILQKKIVNDFFFAQYLETMVTCINQVRFSRFGALQSCTIDLMLEELKI